jgi:hypothetical protein
MSVTPAGTLWKKRRLRMSYDRILKRIFGPMKEEVIGRRRKLHNEENHSLYCLPNIDSISS